MNHIYPSIASRILSVWVLLLLISVNLNAQQFDGQTRESMANLSRNAQAIKVLTFPRPEGIDRELEEYQRNKGYVQRDMAELKKLNAAAINSEALVVGKPLASTVRQALSIISQNDSALQKDVEGRPDQKVLDKLDDGIRMAEFGVKWMANPKEYNATWSSLKDAYKEYDDAKHYADSIDPKAIKLRQAQLTALDESFEKPFLALKAKNEKFAAVQKAVEDDKRYSERRIAESSEKEELRQKDSFARQRGFEGSWTGIPALVRGLGNGQLSLKDAKRRLIFAEGPTFKVLNTSDEVIFYITESHRPEDVVTIAVLREPDEFYGENAPLKAQVLSVVGTDRFETAMGTGKDLIILKALPKITDVERKAASPEAQAEVAAAAALAKMGPCGIGAIVFKANTLPLLIQEVTPNGSADRAGIKALDLVSAIDGKDISELTQIEAITLLRGEKDTVVKLKVERKSEANPLEMSVIRAPLPPVPSAP